MKKNIKKRFKMGVKNLEMKKTLKWGYFLYKNRIFWWSPPPLKIQPIQPFLAEFLAELAEF